MVSRRNFFVIFLMMAILLFMFQFSQVMRENWNYYSDNEYAGDNLPSSQNAWSAGKSGAGLMEGSIPTVYYVGDADGAIGKVVAQWSVYTKYRMISSEKLERYGKLQSVPTMILIDGANVPSGDYLNVIDGYLQRGIAIVFLSLPDVSEIEENQKLMKILGISEVVMENIRVEGIRLFDGAFLGGEAVYKANTPEEQYLQDFETEMPWYITGKGTKTYMVGMLNEKSYDRERFPRIVWRNGDTAGMVFAVNGDYMKDETAFGFLDLFLYEMSDYVIYPVVNAQNSLLVDFPDFSGADEEAVLALYSRNAQAVQQDIFWPSIYSMIVRNNLKSTCFFMTQFDRGSVVESKPGDVDFYLQQINEVGAEAGRSLHYGENMTLSEKVEADSRFYERTKCEYDFRAAYLETIDEETTREWRRIADQTQISTVAGTIVTDAPVLSYYTDRITLQGITHKAQEYSYSRDLRIRSMLSSIGYTNMLVDFHRVLWPESEADSWENYFDIVYSNIFSYWTKYMMYDQTTLSQSDQRVRNFLNFDYRQNRDGDQIYLRIEEGVEECYFLLRTHGESVKSVQNGDFRMLEPDAYLIHATGSGVSIILDEADEILQYRGPFGS